MGHLKQSIQTLEVGGGKSDEARLPDAELSSFGSCVVFNQEARVSPISKRIYERPMWLANVTPGHRLSLHAERSPLELQVGIAAAESNDAALMEAYRSGDVYHSLARMTGFTQDPDVSHWKKTCPEVRQQMKALQLGVNYGMSVPSLARGLDRHPLIASGIIEKHRRSYPTFWGWRDDRVMGAMLDRYIKSSLGWPLRITTSPNKRTLYNFPMQAGGAEMLRLAAWRLCEAGIVPLMLIHDGILFEMTNREQIELAKDIMRTAGRDVCSGFEIGVDVDQELTGGRRYRDKRPVAQKMWSTIMSALKAVKAISEQEEV
jgi:DNA polymerase I-like protein with 3'-5' exonuclease and polymerase domains